MDKRIKHSLSVKLWAVRSVLSGKESCLSAANKIGSRKNTVQRWLALYKEQGSKGLSSRNGSYSSQFKIQVIRYMLKKGLSLIRTAAYFGIPHDYAISRWLKIYRQDGAAGLQRERRGRKTSLMPKKTKKTKSTTKDASMDGSAEKLAALQKEVEYLRAENAFLKKLDALIQQDKAAKAQSKRQKPSGN